MAVELIEPSFKIPPLESLVRDEHGQTALSSGRSYISSATHALQAKNQQTLWELLLRSGIEVPEGPILDAGCGDGLFEALAPHMVFPKTGRRTIIGIDLDRKKVNTAREVAKLVAQDYARSTVTDSTPYGHSLTYHILDRQNISSNCIEGLQVDGHPVHGFPTVMVVDERRIKDFPSIALTWSNSMFHWIREPVKKYAALKNLNRSLKKGGILAMSMSAGGTARDFLRAYANVFHDLDVFSDKNERGFLRAEFEEDPIGSRPVDEISNMVEESGFDIILATALREKVVYTHPKDYVSAVEVYGRDAFLKSVPHYGEGRRRTLWGEINKEFERILRQQGWEEGRPYEYYQFNNFIIATKRSGSSQERRVPIIDIDSILNDKFLQLSYQRLLINAGRPTIKISLESNPDANVSTQVNMDNILKGVFTYASKEWLQDDQDPVCKISYGLQKDRLVLQMDIKTSYGKPIEEIFKEKVLANLKESGVDMSYTLQGNNIRRYEFKIPIV